jgi:hypothetical protein
MEHEKIQWHPAFDAALQIELSEDAEHLIFEPEHLLGKKPMQMDELVIRKNAGQKLHKKIGHIFRGHNIIEYKSPDDYLSINDFYKTYAYACFYQSDTEKICEIEPAEITITFVCNHYPVFMLQHLFEFRKITVEKYTAGIYYLKGDAFPIQLVITHELLAEEHGWLHYLRNDLKAGKEIETVAEYYGPNKNSKLYQAVMNAIIRGNRKEMEAERDMCEALYELFADELEERETKGRMEGEVRGLIETCADFGASRTATLEKLINKLKLNEETAESYMKKYWK